jgi:nicotinamide riboside kinase
MTQDRIYFVGAHSTGKTTMARWVRDRFGLPMIAEVARGVLSEMEAQLDSLRSNVDLVNHYQSEVYLRQISSEMQQEGSFVSDRAFCNLAYAAHHATILGQIAKDERLKTYMQSLTGGIVFYLRPHRELLCDDGVRAGVSWEEVLRIDGMVKFMLEFFEVPYIPVESLSMQERTRLIDRVLELGGVERVQPELNYMNRPTGVGYEALNRSRRSASKVEATDQAIDRSDMRLETR